MILLPMASRLNYLGNPIFGQLVRQWGLNIRVIGVDEQKRIYDFRKLLSDDILRKLIHTLSSFFATEENQPALAAQAADTTLDLVFSALSGGMLNLLEQRREDWPIHLARDSRLEPGVIGTLFDRQARFADFLRSVRQALREQRLDLETYARTLRAVDLREEAVERRLSNILQEALEASLVQRLRRQAIGLHLGCYNWLMTDPRHTSQRDYVLQRLSCFAQYFADTLLTQQLTSNEHQDIAAVVARAVDSGQDRLVIDALAHRFAVSGNTLRQLWREAPPALGTPNTWHLQQILLRLDAIPTRQWPKSHQDWLELREAAVGE